MSIRYALLGLLSKKEQTGYDLYHTFQEQLIYFWNSSHSQVYKELSKMEQDNLVTFEYIYQEGSPNKKIYSLTKEGEKALVEWIIHSKTKPQRIKDEFLLKASSFNVISVSEAISLLQKIIDREMHVMRETQKWKDHGFPDQSSIRKQVIGEYITVEYGIRYSKMYIDWCEWAMEVLETLREEE
ncbi:PadR family transcriptional regulator [Bacillus cereus]|nr:PadR family transcriptional regulator [Bacillus cereus]MCU5552005.1 PadR family transcriptional regulator [Bacillus cereus]